MRDWQIGEPVDDAHGAFVDPQNWGRGSTDKEENTPSYGGGNQTTISMADTLGDKAWKAYQDERDKEALDLILEALSYDTNHSNNWNRAGIILHWFNRYDDAMRCYDKSLSLKKSNVVLDNKLDLMIHWAHVISPMEYDNNDVLLPKLFERSLKAIEMLDEAIAIIKSNPILKHTVDEVENSKNNIKQSMDMFKDVYEEVKLLQKHDKNKLFVFTVNHGNCQPINYKKDTLFKLVKKESDISVYWKYGEIGRVHPRPTVSEELVNHHPKLNSSGFAYARYVIKFKNVIHIAELIDDNVEEIDEHKYDFLNETKKEDLIILKGTEFDTILHDFNNVSMKEYEKGTLFKLIKEENNEYVKDALAVYLDDEKVGYVGNGKHTPEFVSKAADIENISDNLYAEYLVKYSYYHIARIVKPEEIPEKIDETESEPEPSINLDIIYLLVSAGKYDEAIMCLDEIIKLNPDSYTLWYVKGKILIDLKRYDESLECFDKSFELNSKHDLSLTTKGVALAHLKRFKKALNCYQKALFINPLNDYTLKLMGNTYLIGLKDYEEAIKYFEIALKLDSDDSMLWNNLSYAYLKTNDIDKAIEYCDKSLDLDNNNFNAWFTKGEIYFELKKYDDALKYANKAKTINSDDSELLEFIDKVENILGGSNNDEIDYETIAEELNHQQWYKEPLRYATEVLIDLSHKKIKPEDVNDNLEAFEKWMYSKNIVSLSRFNFGDIPEEVKMRYILTDSVNQDSIHFYFSYKQFSKVFFQISEELISSYDDVLNDIRSYETINVDIDFNQNNVLYATDYIKHFLPISEDDIDDNKLIFEKILYNKGIISTSENNEYCNEVKLHFKADFLSDDDLKIFISDKKINKLKIDIENDILKNNYENGLNNILNSYTNL